MQQMDSFINTMYKVSVIVPIYNVERFIERCVKSLMEQTLQDVEYIFVDDAATDNSMKILAATLSIYSDHNIRILVHQENKGLPAARNTGLAVATGEYVFHCDSDDYMEKDMLEALYKKAKETDADIVWCDWFLSFEKNERYMKQPSFSMPIDALKAMLSGGMKYNVWNKLARRSLYIDNDIYFPAGFGMGEDQTMMMLFACAKKVAYVPQAFYHYVKLNTGSFTRTPSMTHFNALRHNVNRTVEFIKNKFGDSLDKEIAFLKLDAKFPFLIMSDKSMYKLWLSWFPEANKYIWENKHIPLRSRIIQWCAYKKQFWIVRLYYQVIIRFVYGIIFR